MSGYLKKISRRKLLFVLALLAVLVFMVCRQYLVAAIIMLLELGNESVLRKLALQRRPFDAQSPIRNVDYLIIGDMCRPEDMVPEGKSYVQISAPGRSLTASYEILRHTYSILKENGGCAVLTVKKKGIDKHTYSVFDIPFFHSVTVERLGLRSLSKKKYFPVLFAQWKSAFFLTNLHEKQWETCNCPQPVISEFCEERNITLMYFQESA